MKNSMRRHHFGQMVSVLALAFGALFASAAQAAYPDKPIRLVVPYPPGGATDVIGRIVAKNLGTALNGQVVVDNKAGASGNIGADAVAKAPADGYTLLLGAMTAHSVALTLEEGKLSYNWEKDFSPITSVGSVPLVFVVNPSVPANNIKELIAFAKSKPGYLTYASSGAGGPQRMAAELFQRRAGVELLHVAYKGSGPAMTDLIGGQVLMMIETVPAAQSFIKSGKLKALAVTTPQRVSMLPDVPSVTEAGLTGFEVSSKFGLLAPANTPKAIIDRLNNEMVKILNNPEVKEQLLAQGAYAKSLSPEQTKQLIRQEIYLWAKVITEGKITNDQ